MSGASGWRFAEDTRHAQFYISGSDNTAYPLLLCASCRAYHLHGGSKQAPQGYSQLVFVWHVCMPMGVTSGWALFQPVRQARIRRETVIKSPTITYQCFAMYTLKQESFYVKFLVLLHLDTFLYFLLLGLHNKVAILLPSGLLCTFLHFFALSVDISLICRGFVCFVMPQHRLND